MKIGRDLTTLHSLDGKNSDKTGNVASRLSKESEQIQRTSDERISDKVDSIKRMVESGDYKIDLVATSKKVVSDLLHL